MLAGWQRAMSCMSTPHWRTDADYTFGKVYSGLERRGIEPLISAKREPLRRFLCDAKHDILKFPRGKVLRPGKLRNCGRFFHGEAKI